MYLTRIKEQKEARAQVKRLHPSTKFLFGGHVKELSQDIKAAEELDPLAPPLRKFSAATKVPRGEALVAQVAASPAIIRAEVEATLAGEERSFPAGESTN